MSGDLCFFFFTEISVSASRGELTEHGREPTLNPADMSWRGGGGRKALPVKPVTVHAKLCLDASRTRLRHQGAVQTSDFHTLSQSKKGPNTRVTHSPMVGEHTVHFGFVNGTAD